MIKQIIKQICAAFVVVILLICFNVLTMYLGCHNRIVSNIVGALLAIIMFQLNE